MSTDILAENNKQVNKGIAGYFIFITVAVLCLYAVNNFSYHQLQPIDPSLTTYYSNWIVEAANRMAVMQIPYATIDFISCLWAINLFLSFCILGNFILLLYRPRWFHHLVIMVIFALAILAVFVIYRVFPFDFGVDGNHTLARIILWVIMAGLAAGMILRLYRFIKALSEKERYPLQPVVSVSTIPPGITFETQAADTVEQTQLTSADLDSTISPDITSESEQSERQASDIAVSDTSRQPEHPLE